MRKILSILLSGLFCTCLFAGPADPSLLTYTQPDGSVVRYYLHGDEHPSWMTDESGSPIEIGEDGFVHPSQLPTEAELSRARARRNLPTPQVRKGGFTGERHFLVILVQYPDKSFIKGMANFEAFFNTTGAGSTSSVRQYYIDQSDGKASPVFDIYGPVTLSKNRANYKTDASGAFKEAMGLLVDGGTLTTDILESYVTSSWAWGAEKYITDVIMIFAGHSRASGDANGIWPCSVEGSNLYQSGKYYVQSFCCAPELQGSSGTTMAGIGHLCHEFGHRMGLPDFYDTNSGDHDVVAAACEDYSLMDHGSYNNSSKTPPPLSMFERSICGWVDFDADVPVISASGSLPLAEIGQDPSGSPRAYVIPTDKDGEFFICEYRCKNSSVDRWSAGLKRGGMLLYHVDKSDRTITQDDKSQAASDYWPDGPINNNGNHPLFYIIPAGAQTSLTNTDMSKVPFPGSQNVVNFNPLSWNNTRTYVSLTGISYNESSASMTLNAHARSFPLINNPNNGAYTAGSNLTLKLSPGTEGLETVTTWYMDGVAVESDLERPVVTLTAGDHTIEALLESGKKLRLDINVK